MPTRPTANINTGASAAPTLSDFEVCYRYKLGAAFAEGQQRGCPPPPSPRLTHPQQHMMESCSAVRGADGTHAYLGQPGYAGSVIGSVIVSHDSGTAVERLEQQP